MQHQQEFEKNNLHLVVIGSGDVSGLPAFRKITGYDGTLLTDPSRDSFEHLGFGSSVAGMLGLKPAADAIKAFLAGYRPGAVHGSVLQLGGALVVDTGGTILYQHRSRKAGDHPPVEKLLTSH